MVAGARAIVAAYCALSKLSQIDACGDSAARPDTSMFSYPESVREGRDRFRLRSSFDSFASNGCVSCEHPAQEAESLYEFD